MDTEKIIEWLRGEYSGIRTGRATPSILDVVRVEAYGSKMPVNQVAGVSIEDTFTIRITPWDAVLLKPIESAIQQSNLGLSVATDDKGLRVIFPKLTDETRKTLTKLSSQKLEEARIRVRTERQKVLNEMKDLDEDSQERAKQDLQKSVDEVNHKLEELYSKKEQEIAQ